MAGKRSRTGQSLQREPIEAPVEPVSPGVEVNVVVDPYADGGVDGIVRRLRRAGLSVGDVLEAVGIVNGHVSQLRLARLETVRGVVAVEPSRSVGVSPPDAELH